LIYIFSALLVFAIAGYRRMRCGFLAIIARRREA
jgi:hypothetical protein